MTNLLLALIYFSFISLGLPDALLGSAWPSMYIQLGVPISHAGVISMVISVGTVFSALMCDRLLRKMSAGLITALSTGLTALAMLGFSLADSFVTLLLWAVPYGLGAGSVDSVLNNYVAVHYEARHMNWLHCFWGVGAALGPYIMGASLTGGLGWSFGYRAVFFVQAALTAVLVFSQPIWNRAKGPASETRKAAKPLGGLQLISLPAAKETLLAFAFYCSLEGVSGLWGASFMVEARGISPELAASLVSLFFFGITAGRLLSGFLTIKLGVKNTNRLGFGLIILGIMLLWLSASVWLIAAGLVLVGLGCAPVFPGLIHLTPRRFGEEASQSMIGMQMAMAYVGSSLAPPFAGFVAARLSIGLYPLLLFIFFTALVFLVERAERVKPV
jgi:MFS family permease